MMNRETFTKTLINQLHELLGEGYTVKCEVISKNNGTRHEGILIKSDASPLAPSFYTEQLYQAYLDGESIFVISRKVVRAYHEETEKRKNFNFSYFKKAYDRVAFRLVNKEWNSELLEDVPHRNFLDLAIVYYIPIPFDDETYATCAITYDLMEQMELTEEELYELAVANTPKLFEGKFQPMGSLLCEMAERLGIPLNDFADSETLMYIVSNQKAMYGASAILYDGFLKKNLEGLGYDKLLILPSSVHECILIPYYKDFILVDYFNCMIRQINEEQVEAHEVLADHAFIYDLANDTITVA